MDLRIALEGFCFEKVSGSTGQRVTFTFTVLYMIADDARLTPFARSTGIFPSTYKSPQTLLLHFQWSLFHLDIGRCRLQTE